MFNATSASITSSGIGRIISATIAMTPVASTKSLLLPGARHAGSPVLHAVTRVFIIIYGLTVTPALNGAYLVTTPGLQLLNSRDNYSAAAGGAGGARVAASLSEICASVLMFVAVMPTTR